MFLFTSGQFCNDGEPRKNRKGFHILEEKGKKNTKFNWFPLAKVPYLMAPV